MPKSSSMVASYLDAQLRNRSIAKLYGDLDDQHRRELIDRFSQLPKQIHSLAVQGLIPSGAETSAAKPSARPPVGSPGAPNDRSADETIDSLSWTKRVAL